MKCLEVYRQKLVKELNINFKLILDYPAEEPVHDFRVGVKRLNAFYYFLGTLNSEINAKMILKPYRGLFKAIGRVRDLHIAESLIIELKGSKREIRKLKSTERSYYRDFKKQVLDLKISSIRTPTVQSLKIDDNIAIQGKNPYIANLLIRFKEMEKKRMTQKAWHRKRILLKRYHHTLDAFQFCPGHEISEEDLKQIRMLEQLLGDWHDRVITVNLLRSFSFDDQEKILKELKRQEKALLDATKIYHKKFVLC